MKPTCQEGTRCKHPAKFKSPTGLLVCGVHRRSIDAWYARLKLEQAHKCVALSSVR